VSPEDLHGIAIDCYRAAVRNVAFYAIDFEKHTTAAYRRALAQVEHNADRVASFAALMRDYRSQAKAYVRRLCGELSAMAASLNGILDGLADGEGDYDARLRSALGRVRGIADRPGYEVVRELLLRAAAAMQEGLDELNRHHEKIVTSLMEEVRALHKKIDSLESAASLDILTTLLSHAEIEKRLEAAGAAATGSIFAVSGFRLAASRFAPHVANQLEAAFLKRLNRILPDKSVAGRWSDEEYLVLMPAGAAMAPARMIEEQLSGSYACAHEGKNVRPTLQVRVTPVRAMQQV
jgi:GGDEF domain-containing protein